MADIVKILMAQPTDDPSSSTTPIVEEADSDITQSLTRDPHIHVSKPNNCLWFTFDDILRSKWPASFEELSAWIDV